MIVGSHEMRKKDPEVPENCWTSWGYTFQGLVRGWIGFEDIYKMQMVINMETFLQQDILSNDGLQANKNREPNPIWVKVICKYFKNIYVIIPANDPFITSLH